MGTFHITAIANGQAFEEKVVSQRVQIEGNLLIVGSAEAVSDTLARVFHAVAETRKSLDTDMS